MCLIKRLYARMTSPLYPYDNDVYNLYILKHLAPVHHNNYTLKRSFLRFCGYPEMRHFKNSIIFFQNSVSEIQKKKKNTILALLKSCTF